MSTALRTKLRSLSSTTVGHLLRNTAARSFSDYPTAPIPDRPLRNQSRNRGRQNGNPNSFRAETDADFLERFKLGLDSDSSREKTNPNPNKSESAEKSSSGESESRVVDADEIFKKMKETGLIPNAVAMLDGLCKDGLVQDAMKLFGLMREKGAIPEVVVYTAVVEPVSNRPELPRSASYLTRHRRTTSVKSSTYTQVQEPSPPSTADNESVNNSSIASSTSIRQSPPPGSDDTKMPAQAVISPPDSAQNSSDDEDTKAQRGRQLENLAELQAAIRIIEQRRESSPNRESSEAAKANHTNHALTLIMPTESDLTITAEVDTPTVETLRRIGHNRANTESVFIDLRQKQSETPTTPSDDETITDEDDSDRSRLNKPPMLRKKSGELVRPALRPSSSRRRPSSMPGTPTFSKAVHFDSHLEHVRHFLQVDRPLAVSAGSSPVEAYDSDTEFPFGNEDNSRQPPFEWEIVTSNFPSITPLRLASPVRLERVFLSTDNKNLVGSVAVANLAFNKFVVARFTLDYWKTTSEVVAEYNNDIRQPKHTDGYDRFNFNIKIADQANLEAKTMFFCVKYSVNGQEYWDNNNATNFQVDFRKKAKPQNGKKGVQGASSRPAHSLPKSNRTPPLRPKTMPATFDDFADGFDSKYDFNEFSQPVNDLLADSGGRLKGVRSAITLSSDSFARRAPKPTGQAFGNRYDFGASLSAAINAANSSLGERSGITMKPSSKQASKKLIFDAPESESPVTMSSKQTFKDRSGPDAARLPTSDKPVIASQSYNELLDKYCFFGSVKSSPQLKDGTLRSGKYDGGNDDGYLLASADSTASNSPQMLEKKAPPPRAQLSNTQTSRSVSPAPMTGFATGTSPMYLQHMHTGFPFHDAYTPTAIRG